MSEQVYIIAEAGINANGDLQTALDLIGSAKSCGADAVKFQKRDLASLYPQELLDNPNSQEWQFSYLLPVLKRCEHPPEHYLAFKKFAETLKIDLIVTPFDKISADFVATLNPPYWKISSSGATDYELIEHCHKIHPVPFFISTGMWTTEEIRESVKRYHEIGIDFWLLLANSSYPTPYEQIGLETLKDLQVIHPKIGYSGHELGDFVPCMAVGLGATVIEKHLTFDVHAEGPDHKASMLPKDFAEMVRKIRLASKTMGRRTVSQAETLAKHAFAKSAVAVRELPAGTALQRSDVVFKSPGKGIFQHQIDEFIGKPLQTTIKPGNYISSFDFEKTLPFSEWAIDKMGFSKSIGVKTRFHDFDDYIQTKPKTIEFHCSTEDILSFDFRGTSKDAQLVIHAPEFEGDMLIDFCSGDPKTINRSIEIIQKTIDKSIHLNKQFPKARVKCVMHIGGVDRRKLEESPYEIYLERAMNSFSKLKFNSGDLEFLPESMPVRANFFGGEHFVSGFTRSEDIVRFCKEFNLKMCFDTSHSQLACNDLGRSLYDFIDEVKPYISHCHIADAKGIHGEGLQIGEGEIDFEKVFDKLKDVSFTACGEVWSAHLNGGREFLKTLHKLQQWKYLI